MRVGGTDSPGQIAGRDVTAEGRVINTLQNTYREDKLIDRWLYYTTWIASTMSHRDSTPDPPFKLHKGFETALRAEFD